jgi:hypothetical protein
MNLLLLHLQQQLRCSVAAAVAAAVEEAAEASLHGVQEEYELMVKTECSLLLQGQQQDGC